MIAKKTAIATNKPESVITIFALTTAIAPTMTPAPTRTNAAMANV